MAKAAYDAADLKSCETLLFRLLEQGKSLKESVFATNTCKVGLAMVYLASDKVDAAEKQLKEVVNALAGSASEALDELRAVALRFHAQALMEKGDEQGAQNELDEAVQVFEKIGPQGAAQLAYALSDLGGLKVRQGKLNEAKDYIFSALDLLETTVGPENPAYMKAEIMYSLCHTESKDEFLNSTEDAIVKMQYEYGYKHPDIVQALRRYTKARMDRGETDKIAEAKEKFPLLEKILKH
jgi:tetratricopeptide (TPR) repeat protein